MKFDFVAFRRTARFVAVVIIALGAGWGALWFVAAREYRGVVDHWIGVGKQAGYEIAYDSRHLSGFPRHVVLHFKNLRWKNTDGIGFHADVMELSSRPWLWRTFDAYLYGQVEINVPLDGPGYALILGGEEGHATVELDPAGIWTSSHVRLTKARVGRAPDYVYEAEELEASAERPLEPPKTFKQAGLYIKAEASSVKLPDAMPSPFGPKMKEMETELRFMGPMPDVRKKESMASWSNAGGIVQFDRLHMDWGPLDMVAKGTMGFDDDLQPEGAFSGAIDNHKDVLKALMDHELIAKRQAGMLDSALSLFAKPASLTGSSGIEIPITVQLGGLFLGPVRVFMFPEIEWQPGTDAGVPQTAPEASAPAADGSTLAPAEPTPAPETRPEPAPAPAEPQTSTPPAEQPEEQEVSPQT